MKVFVVILKVGDGRQVYDYVEHVASSREKADKFVHDRLLYRAACGYDIASNCPKILNMVAMYFKGSSSGAYFIYEKELDE